jgi:hypothetical protein
MRDPSGLGVLSYRNYFTRVNASRLRGQDILEKKSCNCEQGCKPACTRPGSGCCSIRLFWDAMEIELSPSFG